MEQSRHVGRASDQSSTDQKQGGDMYLKLQKMSVIGGPNKLD